MFLKAERHDNKSGKVLARYREGERTYIPFGLELFQPPKCLAYRLVRYYRLVLLKRSFTDFCVERLGDRIFEERLLELVEGYEYGKYFSEGILEIAFSARLGELNFLQLGEQVSYEVQFVTQVPTDLVRLVPHPDLWSPTALYWEHSCAASAHKAFAPF